MHTQHLQNGSGYVEQYIKIYKTIYKNPVQEYKMIGVAGEGYTRYEHTRPHILLCTELKCSFHCSFSVSCSASPLTLCLLST